MVKTRDKRHNRILSTPDLARTVGEFLLA